MVACEIWCRWGSGSEAQSWRVEEQIVKRGRREIRNKSSEEERNGRDVQRGQYWRKAVIKGYRPQKSWGENSQKWLSYGPRKITTSSFPMDQQTPNCMPSNQIPTKTFHQGHYSVAQEAKNPEALQSSKTGLKRASCVPNKIGGGSQWRRGKAEMASQNKKMSTVCDVNDIDGKLPKRFTGCGRVEGITHRIDKYMVHAR